MAATDRKNALTLEWERLFFDADASSLASSFTTSNHGPSAALSLDFALKMLASAHVSDLQEKDANLIYQRAQSIDRAINSISLRSSSWMAETSVHDALCWLDYVRQLLHSDAPSSSSPPNDLPSSLSSSSSSIEEVADTSGSVDDRKQLFVAPKLMGPLSKKQRQHAQRLLDAAEIMFLFKVAIVVYSSTCQTLIDSSYPVLRDALYWKEKNSSTFSVVAYGLQIAPSILFTSIKRPNVVYELCKNLQYGSVVSNPLYAWLKKDIRTHTRSLQELRMRQAEYLGTLLQTKFPVLNSKVSVFVKSDIEQLEEMLAHMVSLFNEQIMTTPQDQPYSKRQLIYRALENSAHQINTFHVSYLPHSRPTWLTRYWPVLSLSTFAMSHIFVYRLAYFNSVIELGEACIGTVKAWWTDWIFDPIVNILKTIRRNNETSELVMTGTDSIRSDLASLERMVVQYAEEKSMLSPEEMHTLAEKVKSGDLTLILQEYEENLKSPIRNALTGDLIRVLLIQVQKAKLDLEIALHALDKLLRSNELNFALLAVAPSLIVLGATARAIKKYLSRKRGSASFQVSARIKIGLREVERRLNRNASGMSATEYGLLIMDLHLLRQYARYIPNRNGECERFLEDVRELEEDDLTVEQKLAVIDRMWRMHDFIRK